MKGNLNLEKLSIDILAEELIKRGKKMGDMNFAQFIMTLASTPVTSIELIIKNKKQELLLTYRNDCDFKGWHFPGSLFRRFESFKEACERIAKEELGVKIDNIYKGIGINNLNSPKGHKRLYKGRTYSIHYVGVVCMADLAQGQTPEDGRFFYEQPKEIIDAHKPIFKMCKSFLKNGERGLIEEELFKDRESLLGNKKSMIRSKTYEEFFCKPLIKRLEEGR